MYVLCVVFYGVHFVHHTYMYMRRDIWRLSVRRQAEALQSSIWHIHVRHAQIVWVCSCVIFVELSMWPVWKTLTSSADLDHSLFHNFSWNWPSYTYIYVHVHECDVLVGHDWYTGTSIHWENYVCVQTNVSRHTCICTAYANAIISI